MNQHSISCAIESCLSCKHSTYKQGSIHSVGEGVSGRERDIKKGWWGRRKRRKEDEGESAHEQDISLLSNHSGLKATNVC